MALVSTWSSSQSENDARLTEVARSQLLRERHLVFLLYFTLFCAVLLCAALLCAALLDPVLLCSALLHSSLFFSPLYACFYACFLGTRTMLCWRCGC